MITLEIGKALTSLLKGVASYAFFAPAGTKGSFVAYTLTGLETASHKDIYSYREQATVDLVVVAPSYRASVDLAQQVRDTLEPFCGTVEDIRIDDIKLLGARASTDGNLYTHTLTYNIKIL